ncbi:MAG TPA: RHS repeat-associated core domain-containing protein, partial [Vicinamibacterales bacterium]
GSVSYTYDAADRRATMTVGGQSQVTYGYDSADRLTSITQGSASVGFTYDSADRRTLLTLPNGVTVESAYDAASQLTNLTYKLGSNTLGDLTYTDDLVGNRLTTGGSWARTGLPAAMASATYDAANQIATWASASFTYDSNGNLTNDGSNTYTWNARNQLTGLAGGITASFAYDGVGRRRAKTVSGTTTGFLYDGLNAVQELTSGSPSANLLTGLGLDEVFTRTDGSGARHLLADILGSSLALTDGSGVVQTEYTYEPFGKTTVTGTSSSNSSRFTGREDDGTGLHYYRMRYQHPTLQRFISEDPREFEAGDPNLYAYVYNAPTGYVDPTGEFPWPMVLGCLIGGGRSAASDYLGGRKINWGTAGAGCAMGALGGFASGAGRAAAATSTGTRGKATGAAARAVRGAWAKWTGRYPTKPGAGGRPQPYNPANGEYVRPVPTSHSPATQVAAGLAQGIASGTSGATMPPPLTPYQGWAQTVGQWIGTVWPLK